MDAEPQPRVDDPVAALLDPDLDRWSLPHIRPREDAIDVRAGIGGPTFRHDGPVPHWAAGRATPWTRGAFPALEYDGGLVARVEDRGLELVLDFAHTEVHSVATRTVRSDGTPDAIHRELGHGIVVPPGTALRVTAFDEDTASVRVESREGRARATFWAPVFDVGSMFDVVDDALVPDEPLEASFGIRSGTVLLDAPDGDPVVELSSSDGDHWLDHQDLRGLEVLSGSADWTRIRVWGEGVYEGWAPSDAVALPGGPNRLLCGRRLDLPSGGTAIPGNVPLYDVPDGTRVGRTSSVVWLPTGDATHDGWIPAAVRTAWGVARLWYEEFDRDDRMHTIPREWLED